ncbi:MAG: patatin-like phospholipase family protein [Gammaproteobacteria bacterium]|nr:patatin-like phospholipase family protein [Gammaproteobacteria bacterium]
MKIDDQTPISVSRLPKRVGLVLPGGGARGAYQVGVLKALAELMPKRSSNPFSVISGTSAGAINAVVLASRAKLFKSAVADMELVWSHFHSAQVFKSDAWTMLCSSSRWLAAIVTGGALVKPPRSLLDNAPLRELLQQNVRMENIERSLDKGHLDAIAVTAAGYDSARSLTFFQTKKDVLPWDRVRRKGRPQEINLDHLMASVAVPMVFPPVQIGNEFFGDGAMRQATPLSPAVRLGAERILVIGVRNEVEDPIGLAEPRSPSFGRIAGYMLDALFMDGLSADLERLTRLNTIIDNVPAKVVENEGEHLRFIEAFVMLPSEDVRELAGRYMHQLPWPVRLLLRGVGAMNKGGRQLLSYLLFESGFTRSLIDLGYRDAMEHKDDLLAFMQGDDMNSESGISGWQNLQQEYNQTLDKDEIHLK